MRLVELLIAIQVLIGLDLVVAQELEDGGEEVLLAVHGACGVIERGVGLLHQIDLSIDDTLPTGIADLLCQTLVQVLRPDGQVGQSALLLLLTLATGGLRRTAAGLLGRRLRLVLLLRLQGRCRPQGCHQNGYVIQLSHTANLNLQLLRWWGSCARCHPGPSPLPS